MNIQAVLKALDKMFDTVNQMQVSLFNLHYKQMMLEHILDYQTKVVAEQCVDQAEFWRWYAGLRRISGEMIISIATRPLFGTPF